MYVTFFFCSLSKTYLEPSLKPYLEKIDSDNEEAFDYMNLEVPCIIFLDSLKAHQKKAVAANVEKWLNHEWQKTKGGSGEFTRRSIKLVAPKGIIDSKILLHADLFI